jgi:membrane-associated protease RseP (regulator of RpoE activity)
VLDKSGIAGGLADLHEGDQVLSVNGQAALSNIQAVQMLREAVGEVVLAVRDTPLTRTPRGTPINPNLSSGLRPINVN